MKFVSDFTGQHKSNLIGYTKLDFLLCAMGVKTIETCCASVVLAAL